MTDQKISDSQLIMNSMERHVQVLKESSDYDADTVEKAVQRWKNK